MRKLLLLLFLLNFCGFQYATSQALVPLSGEKAQSLLDTISTTIHSVNSLTCDFKQVKTISVLKNNDVSYGEMQYSKPDKLSWVYTNPASYKFVVNGDKTQVFKNGVQERGNAGRLLGHLGKLILKCVNGSALNGSSDFSYSYFTNGTIVKILMVPIDTKMSSFLNEVSLIFNMKSERMERVEFTQNGDTTVIEFYNYVIK